MTAATNLLRSAASAMRERAEAATKGPWSASDSWAGANAVTDSEGHPVAICGEDWPENGYEEPGADRRHIASWHPAVALAVADWLDHAAEGADLNRSPYVEDHHQAALAVARANGWHVRFRAANGKVVFWTEPYMRRRAAERAIDLLWAMGDRTRIEVRDVDER